MERNFKGLVAVVFSLGITCSIYTVLSNVHSQSAQAAIVNIKPGGGPRMPILGATGTSRLKTFDNVQIN
jgi:hypothetical protein